MAYVNRKNPYEFLFKHRHGGTSLPLNDKSDAHLVPWVEESLDAFYQKVEESYVVPIPERIEGSRDFIRAVHEFADRYGADIVIREGLYYVEAVYRGFGGAYPKNFCRDFAELLSLCDRFDFYCSAQKEHRGIFCMQYDTHVYYFNGDPFNKVW